MLINLEPWGKCLIFGILVLCIVLLLLPRPVKPAADRVDHGTMSKAERAVFDDILQAVAEGRDTVPVEGVVSHERILTHLGQHYGTLKDLVSLYGAEGGILVLNLDRFHEMELVKARVDALTEAALSEINDGPVRFKLWQAARFVAQLYTYDQNGQNCSDYTVLFHKIALRLDVSSFICYGPAGGGFHAWNMVKLNGKSYFYDITWFDTPTRSFRYLHSRSTWDRVAVINDKWAGADLVQHNDR